MNEPINNGNIVALKGAVEAEYVVSFMYRKKPSEGGAVRTISPYEVSGDKILGWDHDRNALRSFKIVQIIGVVTPHPDEDFKEPIRETRQDETD